MTNSKMQKFLQKKKEEDNKVERTAEYKTEPVNQECGRPDTVHTAKGKAFSNRMGNNRMENRVNQRLIARFMGDFRALLPEILTPDYYGLVSFEIVIQDGVIQQYRRQSELQIR